jgi:trimethylamine:corrinoid methyltransferase-like protein
MAYLDPENDNRIPFTTDHCRVTASLTDCLPNYDWSMVIGMASDVPPEISDRVIVRQALTYSRKPLVFCTHNVENEKDVLEMAQYYTLPFFGTAGATDAKFSDRLRDKTLAVMQHQTEPLAPERIDELDKMQKHWK